MPLGSRSRGSHPGRSGGSAQHLGRHCRDQAPARARSSACAGQQCRYFAQGRRRLSAGLDRDDAGCLEPGLPGEFLRARHACARADRGAQGGQGIGRQRDFDRRLAGASVRGRRLCHLQGGARFLDPRDGTRLRGAGHPRQRHCARRDRYRDPVPRNREDRRARSSRRFRCIGSARRTRSRRSFTCCAPRLPRM